MAKMENTFKWSAKARSGSNIDLSNYYTKVEVNKLIEDVNNKPRMVLMWKSGSKWGTNGWNTFKTYIGEIYNSTGTKLDPDSPSVFSDNLGAYDGYGRSYACKQDLYKKVI